MTSSLASLSKASRTDNFYLLQAEAPSEVVDTITAAEGRKGLQMNGIKKSPSPSSSQHTEILSSEERRELEMLQELIKRKLEGVKS